MTDLRPEERWAKRIIEGTLGVPVEQYDDGSQPSMHDLEIRYLDGAVGAVEVTAAADGASMALWRLLNDHDERWVDANLVGGWLVALRPEARGKLVRHELPRLLALLEAKGVTALELERWPSEFNDEADDLGVAWAYQHGTAYSGSIYITVHADGMSDAIGIDGAHQSIGPWVSSFLKAPEQSDVLVKLARSGRDERHAFVIVPALSTAPGQVVHALISARVGLPDEAPDLPAQVTDVWLIGSCSTPWGMRWSEVSGWTRVSKPLDS